MVGFGDSFILLRGQHLDRYELVCIIFGFSFGSGFHSEDNGPPFSEQLS